MLENEFLSTHVLYYQRQRVVITKGKVTHEDDGKSKAIILSETIKDEMPGI